MCFDRGKSSRTITFEQFKEALQELSKKRFKDKSDEEAVQEIYKLIEGKAPVISGVTVCYWLIERMDCSSCLLFYPSAVIFICFPLQSTNPSSMLPGLEATTVLNERKDYTTPEYCTTVYAWVAVSLLLLGIVVPPSRVVRKNEQDSV